MVAAADKLTIYNGALNACKSRRITTLTDDVEARYVLDDNWDRDFVNNILEDGLWNFAMRTVQIDLDTSYTDPLGGGWNRFDLPSDWIRVAQISSNASFADPDLSFMIEQNYIYSTLSTLYVRYVSNGDAYGNDYSLWPSSFRRYAEAYLGLLSIGRLADADSDFDKLEVRVQRYLTKARSRDAMKEPTKFPPESPWNRARFGRRTGRSSKDYGGLF